MGGSGVRATVLQLALMAAAVANDGVAMRPYLVTDVRGPDLSILERTTPSQLGSPMSTAIARSRARAMRTAATRHCPGCTLPNATVHALETTGGADNAPRVIIAYSGHTAVAVVVERNSSAATDRTTATKTAMAVLAAVQPST